MKVPHSKGIQLDLVKIMLLIHIFVSTGIWYNILRGVAKVAVIINVSKELNILICMYCAVCRYSFQL